MDGGAARMSQQHGRAAHVLDVLLPAAYVSLVPQCGALAEILSRPLDSVLCHRRLIVVLRPATYSALPLLRDWVAYQLPRVRQ